MRIARSVSQPIQVFDDEKKEFWTVPDGIVSQNISVLQEILNLTVQEWKSAATIKKVLAKAKSDNERISLLGDLIEQLKPRLYHCVFSYIISFFMLENGYFYVYSELNELNRKLGLKLMHDKPPKRTKFLNNLWEIRNYSIAHWATAERKNLADSIAGRSWGMGFGVKTHHQTKKGEWDLEFLVPGISKYPMQSIPEMHDTCTQYLNEFDKVCYEYLNAIRTKLPITIGKIQYGR